jgi:hypothetical protein
VVLSPAGLSHENCSRQAKNNRPISHHSKIINMNVVKDHLSAHELSTGSTGGRVVAAISGVAIIGLALMDKKGSTLNKWVKIGSGAVLLLQAVAGYRKISKTRGLNGVS